MIAGLALYLFEGIARMGYLAWGWGGRDRLYSVFF
jgi:hypothetical protein